MTISKKKFDDISKIDGVIAIFVSRVNFSEIFRFLISNLTWPYLGHFSRYGALVFWKHPHSLSNLFSILQYQHNPSSNSSTLSFTTTPTQTVPISATSETTTAITPSSTPTTTTVGSCYRMQMEEYLDATAYG